LLNWIADRARPVITVIILDNGLPGKSLATGRETFLS
jgi:hypothetical protein